MAKPNKSNTTAIVSENESMAVNSVNIEEKATETIETSSPITEKNEISNKVSTSNKVENASKVWIQNPQVANKKVRVLVEVYPFDNEGKALVDSKDAKIFLQLQGYKLVK